MSGYACCVSVDVYCVFEVSHFSLSLFVNKDILLKTKHMQIYRILWSFDILPAFKQSPSEGKDEEGLELEPLPSSDAFIGVLVREPVPFKCRFKVRGSETEEVINSFAVENEELLKAWE